MARTLELSPELSAALGEHFRAFVVEQVAAGRYTDAGEVLRAALCLLEGDAAAGPGLSDAEIRALVEEGDASGEVDEYPAVFFESLRAKYAAMPPGKAERSDG
jgi:antitoxin ParD1/3/4